MSAKIATALHQVMSAVSYVQKTGKNAFHGYKYAGEADLLEVLRPAMVEAGLLLIPSISEVRPIDEYGNSVVIVEYTLAHKDGDVWPHPIRAAGAGNDKNKNGIGDKGVYKALTGANKYLLFKLFQIETGDDPETGDTRGDHRDPSPPKPPAPRTPNVERDRHFGNAADEIRSGENGIPGKAANAEPTAKEWANSIEAHHWIQGEAVTQINAIGNPKSLGEWQAANRESLEALETHCTKRHGWLMNKINERLDYLTNLRAAGD